MALRVAADLIYLLRVVGGRVGKPIKNVRAAARRTGVAAKSSTCADRLWLAASNEAKFLGKVERITCFRVACEGEDVLGKRHSVGAGKSRFVFPASYSPLKSQARGLVGHIYR